MSELKQYIVEMAEDAVTHFADRTNHALDYSESSLAVVEALLAEASDFVDEMPEERMEGLVELLGCYILKVGYREFGGNFYWHEGRDQEFGSRPWKDHDSFFRCRRV